MLSKTLRTKIQPLPTKAVEIKPERLACSTYFGGFRLLLSNERAWGQFSRAQCYSLLSNFMENCQAVSPPGQVEENCGQTSDQNCRD